MFNFFRKIKDGITPIDLNNPDAVVIVTNECHSKKPFENNYRSYCAIKEGYFTSLLLQSRDGKEIIYEKPKQCYVNFLSPKYYSYSIWVGRELTLYEGKQCVGTMQIVDIKNKKLDRNEKFHDKTDILSDKKILNIALKRSLEWGKNFTKPLDMKLMNSVSDLSGTDIDKISKYVIQVRDNILWDIYYSNYNAKSESFLVDCKKITKETYPWINETNLSSLDSQGRYYAWHG